MYQQPQEEIETPRLLLKERGQNLLAGLILVGLFLVLGLNFHPLCERFTNIFTDFQISLLPKKNLSSLPVIIEVDEKSLAAYGQWPWPRYRVAKLLDTISESGAAAIGVDALFVEKDRTSPDSVLKDLEQNFKQAPASAINLQNLPDYDSILGDALNKGPFVLSYVFNFDYSNVNSCSPKSGQSTWRSESGEGLAQSPIFKALGIMCNVAQIEQGAKQDGFINSAPDDDGLYRKTPLVIAYQNRLYPNLALQTFLTAIGEQRFSVESDSTGLNLHVGERTIPLDRAGNLLINLPNSQQNFKKISAADLLSGRNLRSELNGKIVLIGFSATGLHEYRPTPYAPQFLGVELHAAVIDNLDRQSFLQRPDNTLLLELLLGGLLSIGLMVSLTYAKPLTCTVVPLIVAVVLALLSEYILSKTGLVLSPALPIAMVLLTLLTLAVIKYSREHLYASKMTKLVSQTQEGIIESFCSMCEYRDPETGSHIKRTQHYIKALAEHLQSHPEFALILSTEFIDLLFKAAPLHDIGKIGIRDHILLKPGRLADDEFIIMKSHPVIGAEIINSVAKQIGWNPFMLVAHDISLYHQEKWDGSGYPSGLTGKNIPLSARFMALADVYDALISKRVYKPAFSHQTAVNIIKKTSDTHFDPILAEGFLQIHEQFREIALRFLDNEEQRNALLGIDQPLSTSV